MRSTRRHHARRWAKPLAATVSAALTLTLLQAVPALGDDDTREQRRPKTQDVASTPVEEADGPRTPLKHLTGYGVTPRPKAAWPEPGSATVTLGASGASGATAAVRKGLRAGGLPVRLAAPKATASRAAAPTRATVDVLGHAAARKAGIDGLLLKVTRADGRTTVGGKVSVQVDYASFAQAYGGDWAQRLRLVQLPACALTTPNAAACQGVTPLATSNDVRGQKLTADVPAAVAGAKAPLLAVSAAPAGGSGSYTATSLAPSASWQVAGQTGAFTWQYPLRVPPALAGPSPQLGLAYNSASTDGRTASSNNQTSWVGEGFDLSAGYIERAYRSCTEDGHDEAGSQKYDLCWHSDNATMNFGGRAGELVKKSANEWRLKQDDGTRIERRTGGFNSDDNKEYWVVTTTDGTRYYFGKGKRESEAADAENTGSSWEVPVFGDDKDEPCHKDTFKESRCQQTWRWNLDYVVDVHGNTMTYYYGTETNKYDSVRGDKVVSYDRGGWLKRVEYGEQQGKENTTAAPAQVVFTTVERCTGAAADCEPGDLKESTATRWPDVPFEQICTSDTECKDQWSPTFFSRKRLSKVTTQVLGADGKTYTDVDVWDLAHKYQSADTTHSPAMWLESITHSGKDGANKLPKLTFFERQDANRVDTGADDRLPMYKWRIRAIQSETGGTISVNYKPNECTPANLPTPETNTKRCMPSFWSKEGTVGEKEDWFHKFVVDTVIEDEVTVTGPNKVTSYDYSGAAWAFDDSELVKTKNKTWNQWRGFRSVTMKTGEAGSRQLRTETTYLQGMDGDREKESGGAKSVTVTASDGTKVRDDERHQGFQLEQRTFDGADEINATVSTPWKSAPTATEGSDEATYAAVKSTKTRTALDGGKVRRAAIEHFYDSYGMLERSSDSGDLADPDDDTCTTNAYNRNPDTGLLTLLKRVTVVPVACDDGPPSYQGEAISDVRTWYDDPDTYGATPTKGDVVRSEKVKGYTADGTPQYVTTSTAKYDAHGRVTDSADQQGNTTKTVYTPTLGGPVTGMKVTDPAGNSTTSTVDPRWGLVTATVDANKQRTDLEYDGLGRLLKVWLPGRAKASQTPSLEYGYLVRNNAPVVTTTKSLLPNGSVATSHQLSDGLLRPRQTQTPAANSGRVVTTTEYDSRGLAVKEIGPFYNSAAVGTSFVNVVDASEGTPRETETVYDGAGRPIDEIFRVAGAEKWRTKASYHGDHTSVDPPAGETPTATYNNAQGLTTRLLQFKGSSPTGDADTTTYAYDTADRLTEVKDQSGNVWSYEYDVRGRQTVAKDPDTGTTRMTYNDLDQVRTTTDARGTVLTYDYDKIGRQRSLYNGSTKLASWEYDSATVANGKGRLASATRWIGADAYTTSVDSYDVAGRPTKSSVTIPAAEGKLAGTYSVTASYKPDGSLNDVDLPAAGDLPAETVTTGYTATGLPSFTLGDKTDYARETRYSNYGEVLQLTLGTASADKYTWLTNTYEEGTRRLERARIDREIVKTPDADLTYGYDPSGEIRKIADTPEGKTADVQCFTYDYLRRLTDAWSQTATDCAASGETATIGGPAPYWHSYAYDAAGNRTGETRHATGATGTAAITQTTSFTPGGTDAKGGVHVHAPKSAEARTVTSAKEVTAAQSFAYDESGNTVRRTKAATDLAPAVDQKLDWDDEGHLAAVTPYSAGALDEAQKTGFVYDADGSRLLRKEKGAVTLYLGDQEIRLDTAKNTLTGTRYYAHGGQQIAVRTAAGVTWLVGGQNGTAEIAVRAADSAIVQRRILPFGEVRGARPATGAWPGDKAFVGGTADATGLIHLGAREYDPATGRFVSADPALNFDDPQHLNAYAYGRNNPLAFPDPTGLYWGESWISPIGHGVLDVAGLVPGFGEPADLLNGLWYTAEGNYIDAGLSFASAIPIAGYGASAAKGARYVNKAVDAVDTATDAAKAADKVKDAKKVADDITPPATPKPKPKPEPAPPAKAKEAPEVKKGDSGGKKGDGAGEKGGTTGKADDADAPGPSCKVGNSFVPGTTVVMADGTEKPIEEIEPGDEVRAVDPESGAAEAEPVTAAITGHGVKNLVEITVDVDGDRGDATAKVTATDGHPFWVPELHEWVDAKDLKPGQSLTTDKGARVDVVAVVKTVRTATVHNLTVADIHTYLVRAGAVPVLVHNCGNAEKDHGVQGAHPKDHIGKTDQELADRAANDPTAGGRASSLNAGDAQAHIDTAVQANLSKINDWIRKQSTPVSARKEFTHDFGATVIGRKADASGVHDATKLTLVVMKINKGTGGHKGAWVLFTLKAN
ncbi:polymorphic toxin-type HINT domain-containing protein [Streptomyces sp. ME18-1-4]|uniref:polymorphic toxin-type HINT domain-containing protein n=1 Tax=Streptomyces sp. ME18-1-4 TaxID=3028685 RepID=UPI0029ABBD2C|nr:polymorphic toxin-type HINT domain-containing protein [Streptomyces sp. ME18-1-4]MDX3246464.1 polymorphic toxin-type HINT domain-containing protein [Streptomyces sp. ME18-1-4]